MKRSTVTVILSVLEGTTAEEVFFAVLNAIEKSWPSDREHDLIHYTVVSAQVGDEVYTTTTRAPD